MCSTNANTTLLGLPLVLTSPTEKRSNLLCSSSPFFHSVLARTCKLTPNSLGFWNDNLPARHSAWLHLCFTGASMLFLALLLPDLVFMMPCFLCSVIGWGWHTRHITLTLVRGCLPERPRTDQHNPHGSCLEQTNVLSCFCGYHQHHFWKKASIQ